MTKDVLCFTDSQGIKYHVKNLDTKKAHKYVDLLGTGMQAQAYSQICFDLHPDNSEEMKTKDFLAFLKNLYNS